MFQQPGENYQVYKNYDKKSRKIYRARYSLMKSPEVLHSFMPYIEGLNSTGFEFFAFKFHLDDDVYVSSYCLNLFNKILEMDPYIAEAETIDFHDSDSHNIYIKVTHQLPDIDMLSDRICKVAAFFFYGAC